MRAVIYARYSTDNQNEDTINVQVSACAKYAEANDIEIVDIFADEAVSGMKSTRPELDRFFRILPLKAFECVLIYDQSRFSRDIVDWFTFRRAVQNNGVKLVSTTQSFVGGDLNDPSVFATEGINALVNQIHVLQTRQKVVEKMNYMARQGLHTGGKPALGYDVLDKDFVINQEEARTVELIFTMYSQGRSYSEIIDSLNIKGYKTKRGQPFGKNSLSELLRNEKYIGVYIYNKVPPKINGKRNNHAKNENPIRIEDAVPPIISKELWYMVQRRLRNNKQNAKNTAVHEYLLSGKAFCGKCGMAMTGSRSKGEYYYYGCSGKRRLRNCDKKPIAQELLENKVLLFVRSTLAAEIDRKAIAQKLFDEQLKIRSSISPARVMIQKQIKEIDFKINNINEAISNGIYTTSTAAMLSRLEQKQRDLFTELASTERTKVATTMSVGDIYSVLTLIADNKNDDLESKRTLISFIDKVFVFDDRIEIIINPLGVDEEVPVVPITNGDTQGSPLIEVRIIDLLLHITGEVTKN